METPLSFGEILDAADKLSLVDQVELIMVLRHRVAEHRRDLLAEEIEQARREFKVGQCQPMPPADILKAVAPGPDLELPRLLRSGGPQQGLSTLAGGWEGSDELIERVAEIRRTGPRDTPGSVEKAP